MESEVSAIDQGVLISPLVYELGYYLRLQLEGAIAGKCSNV